jgi:UDP-N-acetylmuramoyl-tripeptide--D-alanyl-D-alanine ligase
VTVGPRARVIASEAREAGLPAAAVVELDDSDAAIAFLRQTIRRGDVVLLKGSQGVKLDRVVPALEVRPPEPKPDAGLM